MKKKPLSQQVAIVTGGGTGIGRSFTEALASVGVKVIIASRKDEILETSLTSHLKPASTGMLTYRHTVHQNLGCLVMPKLYAII